MSKTVKPSLLATINAVRPAVSLTSKLVLFRIAVWIFVKRFDERTALAKGGDILARKPLAK